MFSGALGIPKSDETCQVDEDEDDEDEGDEDEDEDGRVKLRVQRGRERVHWFIAPFLLCQWNSLMELMA